MQYNSADYKDYKIKIVVLGRRKSGKTSFIRLITGTKADNKAYRFDSGFNRRRCGGFGVRGR